MPTYVRPRKRKSQTPESAAPAEPPERPWSAADLYRRSQDNRRVLLLELLAWAIVRAESCATKEEFKEFEEQLREARRATWGQRPWPGAKEQDRFLEHVTDMARGFVATGHEEGWNGRRYPSRNYQPDERRVR